MLVLIVLLVIFGLAVLFSSSEYNGRVRFGDSAYYFKKQLCCRLTDLSCILFKGTCSTTR